MTLSRTENTVEVITLKYTFRLESGSKPDKVTVTNHTLKENNTKKAAKLFNQNKYNYRALIESVNSAIKRTLGSYVCSKRADQQQKQVTIKALAYNLEIINRTIKIWIFINKTYFYTAL